MRPNQAPVALLSLALAACGLQKTRAPEGGGCTADSDCEPLFGCGPAGICIDTSDHTAPAFLYPCDVTPSVVALNTQLRVVFETTELPAATPVASFSGTAITFPCPAVMEGSAAFACDYTMTGTEPEGALELDIHMVDLPGNAADLTCGQVQADLTAPVFSACSASAASYSLALPYAVHIVFTVDAPLPQDPVVKVIDAAASVYNTVMQDHTNNTYDFRFNPNPPPAEGATTITITGSDQAGNVAELDSCGPLTVTP